MRKGDSQSLPSLGFLTIVEHEQHGLFGGYLLLTMGGRPIEFHCTAPIKPNRAQQILFGPTLESYLYGEQIGQTLINKAGAKPLVLCTDLGPTLAVRDYTSLPVAWVLPARETAGSNDASLPGMVAFRLGNNRLAVAVGRSDDRQEIAKRLESLPEGFDLAEPFARIREAIEEAQRGSRAAA